MSDKDDKTYDVYMRLAQDFLNEDDTIRVRLGEYEHRYEMDLDIRDAVYFRHLLDLAISDYEKAMRG